MISKKLRNSAKGQQCTFRIPGVCNGNPETTVLCHGPDHTRGKAMKTADYWAAYGCSACHSAMDLREVPDWNGYWLNAIRETQAKMVQAGSIVIPVTVSQPKTVAKIMPGQSELQRRMQG